MGYDIYIVVTIQCSRDIVTKLAAGTKIRITLSPLFGTVSCLVGCNDGVINIIVTICNVPGLCLLGQVAKITIIMGGSYGPSSYAMVSTMRQNLRFTCVSSIFSVAVLCSRIFYFHGRMPE